MTSWLFMGKKKKGKEAQPLPEEWMKPLKRLGTGTALLYASGLGLVAVMVLTLFSRDPELSLPDFLVFGFAGLALVSAYSVACGHLLGCKWGKKAPWQGFAVLVTAGSVVSTVALTLLEKLGFTYGSGAMGLLLWYFMFKSYYQTSGRHAIYSVIILNVVAIVLGLGLITLIGGLLG